MAVHAKAADARRKAAAKKTQVYHAVVAKSVQTRNATLRAAVAAVAVASTERRDMHALWWCSVVAGL